MVFYYLKFIFFFCHSEPREESHGYMVWHKILRDLAQDDMISDLAQDDMIKIQRCPRPCSRCSSKVGDYSHR